MILYINIPIQNFIWMLIRIPPIELVVLPKGAFIKTQVSNPTIGNTILPKIISPIMVKSLITYNIQFNDINSFYFLYCQVIIIISEQ